MSFFQALGIAIVDAIFPPRDTQLLVRAATFSSVAALLEPQVVELPGLRAVALLPYRAPLVQALILEAKYEKSRKAQRLLGEILFAYIKEWREEDSVLGHADPETASLRTFATALIPLPLGKKRRRERGYNQVEEIARFAKGHDTSPRLVSDVLVRVRDTVPQTSLGREARKTNMTGAFGARIPHHSIPSFPAYFPTRYILLDDVLTTGATLAAACAALQEAGVTCIVPLALAH